MEWGVGEQEIRHEATIASAARQGKGCYMVPILYCSADSEMRGKPVLKRGERVGLPNCSTLGAELWVSSTYDCAIRLVTQ